MNLPELQRRFGGIDRLYGQGTLSRLAAAHACVVGIGGVGSWAAEALARSGIGRITLIELDHVAESNINRQVQALEGTLGQAKVATMKERIAQINPDCVVACVLQIAKAIAFYKPVYGTFGLAIRSWAEKKAFLEPALSRRHIQRHHAAVAIRQALRFSERVSRQRENSLYLLSLLEEAEGVVLPHERSGAVYNYHLFPVLMSDDEERTAVAAAMLKRGVDTSRIYSDAINHSRKLGYSAGCPVSESVAARLLLFRITLHSQRSDIERVAQAFLQALNQYRLSSRSKSPRPLIGKLEPVDCLSWSPEFAN